MQISCQFCNRGTTNNGANAMHEKHCKSNPNYVKFIRSPNAGLKKGNIPWNKALINDPRCKMSEATIQKLRALPNKGRASSKEKEEERIRKITLKARANNGGLRKGSGRGKKGWYKGYWCDSSWELAFVIYNLEHNILFTRNTEGFVYEFNGVIRKYFPDFIIDGCYYEIKGYFSEQNLQKINSFAHDLKIIDKNEIKNYLTYVENKYGKDFIKLYGE